MIRCVTFPNRDSAAAYLRPLILKPDAASKFRSLLTEETFNVYRLSDDQLVEQIAVRLAQGALCATPLAQHATPLTPAVKYTKDVVESLPSAPPPPKIAALPKSPAPEPSPVAPEINPLEEMDHDAQAATLEAASRDGAPFCEVCEKARYNKTSAQHL